MQSGDDVNCRKGVKLIKRIDRLMQPLMRQNFCVSCRSRITSTWLWINTQKLIKYEQSALEDKPRGASRSKNEVIVNLLPWIPVPNDEPQ